MPQAAAAPRGTWCRLSCTAPFVRACDPALKQQTNEVCAARWMMNAHHQLQSAGSVVCRPAQPPDVFGRSACRARLCSPSGWPLSPHDTSLLHSFTDVFRYRVPHASSAARAAARLVTCGRVRSGCCCSLLVACSCRRLSKHVHVQSLQVLVQMASTIRPPD
jgi:hypothetical protein